VPDDSPEFLQGLKLFLQCSPALGGNLLYRADALDMTAQYLGSRIDALVLAALSANRSGDNKTRDRCAAQALELMSDVDSLLSNHPINRLDRWVSFARAWGDTPAESDYYESDAKRLITTWGGPRLSEYASKTWSGLIGSYYRARWAGWFNQWATGQKFDLLAWEENWIRMPMGAAPKPTGNPLSQCRKLIAKADQEK
jgi:alpha-N-acetylglucosaminidase